MKANLKIMKLMVEELLADPRRVKYLTEEEIAEIDLTINKVKADSFSLLKPESLLKTRSIQA